MPGQKSIQVIRKRLFVALTESGRTAAGIHTAGAHRIEEISHVQARANVFRSVQLAARAEGVTTFLDDLRGQWDITRNNEVAGSRDAGRFHRLRRRIPAVPAPNFMLGEGGRFQ